MTEKANFQKIYLNSLTDPCEPAKFFADDKIFTIILF